MLKNTQTLKQFKCVTRDASCYMFPVQKYNYAIIWKHVRSTNFNELRIIRLHCLELNSIKFLLPFVITSYELNVGTGQFGRRTFIVSCSLAKRTKLF